MKRDAELTRDLERFTANITRWQGAGRQAEQDGDMDLARLYERDVADLRAVLALVRAGQWPQAARLCDRLDTLVRDQIPPRLYRAIYEAAE